LERVLGADLIQPVWWPDIFPLRLEPSPPSGLVGEKEIAMGPEEQSIQSEDWRNKYCCPVSVSANPAAMERTGAHPN